MYLPVLGLTSQEHAVLGLGDVIILIVFGLLDVVLGLDSLVLREGAVVTLLEGC